MVIRKNIKFKSVKKPIVGAVTKFGGQPSWLEEPQWPISKELGSAMQFICQIKLTEAQFPGCGGKVAYVFMSYDEEEVVDGTWDPNGGENAVIIQPGGKPQVKVKNLTTGPTLQKYVKVLGKNEYHHLDSQYSVELTTSKDPEFIPEKDLDEFDESDDEAMMSYFEKCSGNKIGGTPSFMQGDAFPGKVSDWYFLMQLYDDDVPFSVNFGTGISYTFINKAGTYGKFLWQCS